MAVLRETGFFSEEEIEVNGLKEKGVIYNETIETL